MFDAVFATIVGTLNSGVVLVAYALMLGASSTVIGVLAAIPFLTQLLQAPAVALLERVRARRRVAIACLFVARLMLPLMAALGYIEDRRFALALLVLAETVHCDFNALAGCAGNSWIRDFIPEHKLGVFFARRTIWAPVPGIAGTAAAAGALQFADPRGTGSGSPAAFAALYGVGFLASLVSTWQLARVPEPAMPAPVPVRRLTTMLIEPLRDPVFRRQIRFFASWQFAVNLAARFFSVFMMRQLGLSAGFVLLMSIVSQAANIVVLRGWGALSDRSTNKTVLTLAAPAFLPCIVAMALAGQVGPPGWTVAYITVLHVLIGMVSAGVAGDLPQARATRARHRLYRDQCTGDRARRRHRATAGRPVRELLRAAATAPAHGMALARERAGTGDDLDRRVAVLLPDLRGGRRVFAASPVAGARGGRGAASRDAAARAQRRAARRGVACAMHRRWPGCARQWRSRPGGSCASAATRAALGATPPDPHAGP